MFPGIFRLVILAFLLAISFSLFPQNLEKIQGVSASPGFILNQGQVSNMNGEQANEVLYYLSLGKSKLFITGKGIVYTFAKADENEEEKEHGKDELKHREPEKFLVSWYTVEFSGASISSSNIFPDDFNASLTNFYNQHVPGGLLNVKSARSLLIKNIYPNIDFRIYVNQQTDSKSSNTLWGIKYDFIVRPGANPSLIQLIYHCNKKPKLQDGNLIISTEAGELVERAPVCFLNNTAKTKVVSGYNLTKKTKHEFQLNFNIETYDTTKTLIVDPVVYWATMYCGNSFDGFMGLEVDDLTNDFYLTGYTSSTDFPLATFGTAYMDNTMSGVQDILLLRFSNNGILKWSTFVGGSQIDEGDAIDIASNGNIFITGRTNSTNLPLLAWGGAYFDNTYGGPLYDAFIMQFTNAGTLLWSSFIGGNGWDMGNNIKLDSLNNIYITGETQSSDLITVPWGSAYYDNTYAPNLDGFVMRFSNTGIMEWSTYLGGSGNDYGLSIDLDKFGNILVSGYMASTTFPTMAWGSAYFDNTFGGVADSYLTLFTPTGVMKWSTYFGGSDWDWSYCSRFNSAGEIFITGYTRSANFPVLDMPGSYFDGTFATSGTNTDVTIANFSATGVLKWSTYLGGIGNDFCVTGDNISFDSFDRPYILTEVASSGLTTTSPGCSSYVDPTFNGNRDHFIIQLGSNNEFLWSTYWGGNASEYRSVIDHDQYNNFFVAGEWGQGGGATSATYPLVNPGGGSYYSTVFGGVDDAFIGKFIASAGVTDTTTVPGVSLCNGDSVQIGGDWYSSPGVYYEVHTAISGCDSITLTNVALLPFSNVVSDLNYDFCNGDSILLNTVWYSESNTLTNALTTTHGCDSVIRYIINELPANFNNLNYTICPSDSINIAGSWYGHAGLFNDTLNAVAGCDSILNINISVHPPAVFSQSISICTGDSINIGGTWYGSSVSIADTLSSVYGCDSMVSINIAVLPRTNVSQAMAVCFGDSLFLQGNWQTATGFYYDTLVASNGCDSVITTSLTILPISASTVNYFVCAGDSVLVNGNWYNMAGTYYDTLSNSLGCDSMVASVVTINPVSGSAVSYSTCPGDSVQVNSNWYNTAGTFYDTLNNSLGCDSILIITITLNPNTGQSLNYSICTGDSILVNGNWLSSAGTFYDTLINTLGCDSIIAITVDMNLSSSQPLNYNICPGDSLAVNGTWYNLAGTYYDTLSNSFGCDSILVIDISNNMGFVGSQNLSICSKDSIYLQSAWQNTTGTYYDTLTAFNGCDSILTTNLTVTQAAVNLGPDQMSCLPVMLVASGGMSPYAWNTGATTSSIMVDTSGLYWVQSGSGICTALDSVFIAIVEQDTSEIFLPNIFTPNNDGVNDKIQFKYNEINSVLIYNRWGVLLQNITEAPFEWSGKAANGEDVPGGVYFYIVHYYDPCQNNREISVAKSVQLIR